MEAVAYRDVERCDTKEALGEAVAGAFNYVCCRRLYQVLEPELRVVLLFAAKPSRLTQSVLGMAFHWAKLVNRQIFVVVSSHAADPTSVSYLPGDWLPNQSRRRSPERTQKSPNG